jgi:intein/homing endonuclease
VPDKNEVLILSNRRILADQIEFLLARLPEKSRLRQSGERGTSSK